MQRGVVYMGILLPQRRYFSLVSLVSHKIVISLCYGIFSACNSVTACRMVKNCTLFPYALLGAQPNNYIVVRHVVLER